MVDSTQSPSLHLQLLYVAPTYNFELLAFNWITQFALAFNFYLILNFHLIFMMCQVLNGVVCGTNLQLL